ncbi:acyltransferase [Photobacterium phosphoreum]|uniref:acyltransferase n=1 Tax=Photobacterium phosphoreum TaxID=659 RepID=UPI001E5E3DD5|nr:acyltransferase [Photobacterium phosphoreum]MCD9470818.1 hypothetical protein [Photobacterium phosphoreum]
MNRIITLLLKFISLFYTNDLLRMKLYHLKLNDLRKNGVSVGENSLVIDCKFSSSSKGDSFTIGKNSTCTGVTFLGHDASPTLFIKDLVSEDIHPCLPFSRKSYRSPIVVGDNVFIGYNTTILPGVNICSNVIIAAGSIVTKSITYSGVYAGNPAKKISELDCFIAKYKKKISDNKNLF